MSEIDPPETILYVDLATLKVGDEVTVEHWSYGEIRTRKRCLVERVLSREFVVDGTHYSRRTGRRGGPGAAVCDERLTRIVTTRDRPAESN